MRVRFGMKWTIAVCLLVAVEFVSAPARGNPGESCEAHGTIVSLANKILDGREGLSSLIAGRYGRDAAYLLIHYGNLDPAATSVLLDRIDRERDTRVEELRAAFEISTGLRRPEDVQTAEDFRRLGWSGWRALILADDGVRFFKLIGPHAEREAASISAQFADDIVAYYPVKLLADVSDETRARVAATAERVGEVAAALTLLADQRDLTAFWKMAAQYPDHRLLNEVRRFPETFGASVREQRAPINLGRGESRFREEWRARYFELRRVDYRFGASGFLMPFLNVTGKEQFVSDAAEAVNDAIDDGWLDPVTRPEQAMISLYRQLIERMGQKAVDKALSGMHLAPRVSRNGPILRDMTHGFIASNALRDTVLGDISVPQRPSLLDESTNLDWDAWVRIALLLRDGDTAPIAKIADVDVQIGVNLAFTAGLHETAIEMIDTGLPATARLRDFKGYMTRLDQQCDAHLWTPGTGFGSFPIYRF